MTKTAVRLRKAIDDRAPATRKNIMGDATAYQLTPPLVRGKVTAGYIIIAKRVEGVFVYPTTKYGNCTSDDVTRATPLWESPTATTEEEALAALGYVLGVERKRTFTLVRELPGVMPGWQAVFRVDPPYVLLGERKEARQVAVMKTYAWGKVDLSIVLVTEPRKIEGYADLQDFWRRGECLMAPSDVTLEESLLSLVQRAMG